jgi:hypothetical protein
MSFIRKFAVPLVLITVAVNHIYRHFALQQSAWGAGCGFGMFSTVDYHDTRFYRCYLRTKQGRLPISVATELADADRKARVLPTADNMTKLASQLAQTLPDLVPQTVECDSLSRTPNDCRIDSLQLELWRMQIEPATHTLRSQLLRQVEVPCQKGFAK